MSYLNVPWMSGIWNPKMDCEGCKTKDAQIADLRADLKAVAEAARMIHIVYGSQFSPGHEIMLCKALMHPGVLEVLNQQSC